MDGDLGTPALRLATLERARLTPNGASGDGTAPLTLLFAPAGMGKTVLATQWAQDGVFSGFDVVWVTAPDTAEGEGAFWQRCLDALAPDSEARAAGGAKEATRRVLSRLRRPTMLVVDDYQHVSSAQLDLEVAALLGLSEHLHLTVLSRRFAALDGPLVTSQVPVVQLGAPELAFTADEVGALAELYGAGDADRAKRLHEQTRGWPVAVRLLLQRIAAGDDRRDLTAQISRYVVQRTESVATAQGRRALLIAALCEQISLEMLSEELRLPYGETERLVRELCELGLLEQRWHANAIRLEGHSGLTGILGAQAAQELGAQQARELQRRHALDLSQDAPVPAALLLLRLGCLEDASRVVSRDFLEVVEERTGLLAALRRIPVEDMRDDPVLLGARLVLEIPVLTTPREELDLLQRTMRAYARDGLMRVDGELRIATLALLVVAERMRGNGTESLRLARDLEQRLNSESERTIVLLRRSLSCVHAIIALTGALAGDLALAQRGFTRTLRCAEEQGNVGEQLRAWNGLALVAALRGEMARAREHLDRAETLARLSGLRSPHQSWVNGVAARMLASFEAGEHERVRAALDEISPMLPRTEQWPILTIIEASQRRLEQGDDAALQLIAQRSAEAELAFRTPVFSRGMLSVYAANLTALRGDYARAERLLDELPEAHPDVVVAVARLRLLTGDPEAAAGIASPALRGGGTVAETAAKLFLTPNTVKFHLRSIYRKLRATSREEALEQASSRGLLGAAD